MHGLGLRGLTCALLLASAPGVAAASPWTRDAGGLYLNLSYARIAASSYFGPNGGKPAIGADYTQQTLGLYAEIGLQERWLTALCDWQLVRSASLSDGPSAAGVGDLRLGAASGLLVAPFRLTATLLLGLPVGDPAPGVGGDLATGGGDLTLEAHLAAGHSLVLGPVGLYGILDAGFRKRGLASRDGTMPTPATTRYADELLYLAELGAQIRKPGFDRVWLAVRSNGLDSLAADRDIVDGYSGLRPGTRYTGLGIALDARVVATWHVGGEVDSALDARLVPAGAALKLYLAFER
ncbi:MAG TPA: hypothetical protein VKN99_17820 [Polyangia bacterium]|nr:hypothetical protein [Polyangia bacterium]